VDGQRDQDVSYHVQEKTGYFQNADTTASQCFPVKNRMLIEGGHPDSLIMTVKCGLTKNGDDWAVGKLFRSHVYGGVHR
jgi:hypothetical protein